VGVCCFFLGGGGGFVWGVVGGLYTFSVSFPSSAYSLRRRFPQLRGDLFPQARTVFFENLFCAFRLSFLTPLCEARTFSFSPRVLSHPSVRFYFSCFFGNLQERHGIHDCSRCLWFSKPSLSSPSPFFLRFMVVPLSGRVGRSERYFSLYSQGCCPPLSMSQYVNPLPF